MANQKHLDILKQGVPVWNRWRKEHPDIHPDLAEADFGDENLTGVNFSKAQLHGACFFEAELAAANFSEADLGVADFRCADLGESKLKRADLGGADFDLANLSKANFRQTFLAKASFRDVRLSEADLSKAKMAGTMFVGVNLSRVKGLATVQHLGPSPIDIDTIYRSQGKIPEVFLKGAGIPDSFLEIMAAITTRPIDFYKIFISYSSRDQSFTERLHADLQSQGIRCWYAPEDLKIGDRIRPRIDESIRLHDKLLLVLSMHSIASQWVEQEVETALEKERKENRTVLFPIRLDEAVMEIEGGWSALIRNTRHIGDFTRWKDHDAYQKALKLLLRDLKAERKPTT